MLKTINDNHKKQMTAIEKIISEDEVVDKNLNESVENLVKSLQNIPEVKVSAKIEVVTKTQYVAGGAGLALIPTSTEAQNKVANEGDAIFTDKQEVKKFYNQIKEKAPKVELARDNIGEHDYKERPDWAKNTSQSLENIQNENFIYIGEVRKGESTVIEGLGKKFCLKKKVLYEGYFKEGELHGHGRMISDEQHFYVGQFEGARFYGRGRYSWPNGAWQEGQWINNKMEGFGTFNYKDGSRYEGEWLHDKKHGKGVVKYANG
jgi:hypothetical protein